MANLNMLAGILDLLTNPAVRIPLILVLVGIIVAWVIYRRKNV